MMNLRELITTISADLLRVMSHSGVEWGLVYRKGGTLEEAQAYAWGNTLVFDLYGPVFLLAMTRGKYVTDQVERYASGRWLFTSLYDLNVHTLTVETERALDRLDAYD